MGDSWLQFFFFCSLFLAFLQVLNKDITRVLTTILVATTVCTIYNAALFTNLAIQVTAYKQERTKAVQADSSCHLG